MEEGGEQEVEEGDERAEDAEVVYADEGMGERADIAD